MLDRRQLLEASAAWCMSAACAPSATGNNSNSSERQADVVIIGASLGGCSAALAALRNGLRVVMTEETDWIGGQLTSQAVPPDEHSWIETHGANASYRQLRTRIRDYYRRHYPLTDAAQANAKLNPGNGTVSRLCHEPRVALAVLRDWFAPYLTSGQLQLLLEYRPTAAQFSGDQIRSVTVQSDRFGRKVELSGLYFLDASELGDLLPLTNTEFVTGAESQDETGEIHAASKADPNNQQAFTMCFPVEHVAGQDYTIDQPDRYRFWREFVPQLSPAWPGRLLDFTYTHPRSGTPRRLGFNPLAAKSDGVINLWRYRRIVDSANFANGAVPHDVSLINWPQNDYMLGNLVGVSRDAWLRHVADAKQLSLSLMYWLQTEAPRMDGGTGYPGLRMRGDLVGTEDGLAKYPYVRESRRLKARFTVKEQHVGRSQREEISGKRGADLKAAVFSDSVGVGSYAIDLHPSTTGDNYIDFTTLPFQVPLGALVPRRVQNLIAACKNIGATHVTGGCYRLHPVEWGIGEAAGCLAAYCLKQKSSPHEVCEKRQQTESLQKLLQSQGVEISWAK